MFERLGKPDNQVNWSKTRFEPGSLPRIDFRQPLGCAPAHSLFIWGCSYYMTVISTYLHVNIDILPKFAGAGDPSPLHVGLSLH